MKTLKQFQRNLTKPKLRAWLQSQAPNKVVGKVGEECDCPIARYGHSLGMGKDVTVNSDVIARGHYYNDDREFKVTPQWAENFIEAVDDVGEQGDNITASCALTKTTG
jgi:hypothetical protein